MSFPLVAANWKMNTTLADAHVLANGVVSGAEHMEHVEVVLCPPTIWLTELAHLVPPRRMSHLKLGIQNIYSEDAGAFTGETSPLMAKEVAEYAIIGHSERTHLFHEDRDLVADKLHAALHHGMRPILCVGEDRRDGDSKRQLVHLLNYLVNGIPEDQLARLTVAYEPVWAISSVAGAVPATPDYAAEVITALHAALPAECRVLYGGSANADNARLFLQQDPIDGLLVGGASLKLKNFLTICQHADDLGRHNKS